MSRECWGMGDGKRLKRVIEGGILATEAGGRVSGRGTGLEERVCWRFKRGPYGFFTLKCKRQFFTK